MSCGFARARGDSRCVHPLTAVGIERERHAEREDAAGARRADDFRLGRRRGRRQCLLRALGPREIAVDRLVDALGRQQIGHRVERIAKTPISVRIATASADCGPGGR